MTTHKEALEAAYLAGFNASGEGYNGEYPFGDKMQDPAENRVWKKDRDNYIKEALAQPEQEPVACIRRNKYDEYRLDVTDNFKVTDLPVNVELLLYTTPPQRKPWVSLTPDEFNNISSRHSVATIKEFVQEIEFKLREKNT